MCGRREISERHGEAGMLLMELAVSLPVFVLLLSFLAFAVAWSWRSYQREIADAELRQEMQIAAARIVESALLSDHIREYMTGVYEMRQRVRRADQSEQALDRYWLRSDCAQLRVVSHHRVICGGGRICLRFLDYPRSVESASLSHRHNGDERGDRAYTSD